MRHLHERIRDESRSAVRSVLAGFLIMLVGLLPARFSSALGTLAGTDITNQATATYTLGATSITEFSNTNTTTVAELLNITVIWQDAANVTVSPGDTDQVLTFLVTNTGNGSDDYTLVAQSTGGGGDFDPTLVDIYFDTNINGVYDAGTDAQYLPGINDPTIAADAAITIFLLNDIPSAGLSDGDLGNSRLTATSNTPTAPGPWAPGTVVAGAGEALGTDAVVGLSGGSANEIGTYVISSIVVSLVKSATIVDPFGGTEPVPGAVITYSIVVTVIGSGTALGVVITDPIPMNTTYNTGTLTLNTGPLTDVSDVDAGDVGATAANTVTVDLGDLAAASPAQTITFDVTID